jgi:hypothetical protein
MRQEPNPIHFFLFLQREMARAEKMELCTENISFKELSTLHRKDSRFLPQVISVGGYCLRKYCCQWASMSLFAFYLIESWISWISLFPGRF